MKNKAGWLVAIFILSCLVLTPRAKNQKFAELEKKLETLSGKEKVHALLSVGKEYRYWPNEIMSYANQALKLSREINYPEGEARAFSVLGEVYLQLEDYKQALECGQQAFSVFEKSGNREGMADSFNALARTHLSLGSFDKALEYNINALKIWEELGDTKKSANILFNIGSFYATLKESNKALEYYSKAMEKSKQLGDKYDIASTLMAIASVHRGLRNYQKALDYYRESQELYKKINSKEGYANVLDSIGSLFYQLRDYDRALECYQEEVTAREELGEKTILAHIFHNMALIYYDKKNFSKAREYHEKGLNINIELGSEKKIARSLIEVAFFYGQLKNFDKAINYLRTSLKIVKKIKAVILERNIYSIFYQVYAALGQYKSAVEYFHLYHKTEKKVINEKSREQINRLQVRYEVEKKEKEIEILRTNNELKIKENEVLKKSREVQDLQLIKTRITRNAAIIGFILVLIILALLFRKYLHLLAFWKKQKYIGQFKLMDKIGSGAMGTVYKAHSILDKSELAAVKVLKEEFFTDTTSRKRFKQEATIIDKLDHPNIIHIFERGEYKQQLFIAMEFLEGKTLEHKINENGQLPLQECLRIMVQISEALVLIHSKNIIHRDLKPANIMLIEKDGRGDVVKLLDFGLARMELQTRLTQSGNFIGTLEYMPPEQVTEGYTSPANDIFSLGVIFYRLLSQHLPFVGDTAVEIMREIINKTPLDVSVFRIDIPEELNDLVMKMLDKKPGQRPSAKWIRNTLQSLFHF